MVAQFTKDQEPFSGEEFERLQEIANRELVIRCLQDLAFQSTRVAESLDELAKKCPSRNGGFLRAASKLASTVQESLEEGEYDGRSEK